MSLMMRCTVTVQCRDQLARRWSQLTTWQLATFRGFLFACLFSERRLLALGEPEVGSICCGS